MHSFILRAQGEALGHSRGQVGHNPCLSYLSRKKTKGWTIGLVERGECSDGGRAGSGDTPLRQLLQLIGVTTIRPERPVCWPMALSPESSVQLPLSCGESRTPTHHFLGLAGPGLILSMSRLLAAHRK